MVGGKKDIKSGVGLGRTLNKAKAQTKKGRRVAQQEGYLHTTDMQDGYDWGRLNLQSVTEQDTYTDFMNTAEMAGREFDAEKWNIKLLNAQTRQVYIDTGAEGEQVGEATEEQKQMRIPRRPAWAGLTAEQLKEGEQAGFLEWRRELAELQETTTCIVTPYEKNLEFWRQLWRVIERSELVIQIVDSRHPLLFRCPDVELYVKEVSGLKQNLLLVNKADFLNLEQRQAWAEHFEQQGINFAFFSAITEDESVLEGDEDDQEEEDTELGGRKAGRDILPHQYEDDTEEDTDESTDEDDVEEDEIQPAPTTQIGESEAVEEETNTAEIDDEPLKTDILNCAQMVRLFRSYKRHETENVTVGFIGYPNVGKSSTINKLLSAKKVRVSETPGKTKHFQTLVLEEDVTLCDCPGLVMPSVCNSKAGMVLQGILPIDQLRDHVPVINLLLDYIPGHVLESRYGLVLPQHGETTCEQLLGAYGTLRGFMTAGGRPDQARAARIMLKDYVGGKLLHAEAPPGREQAEFHTHPREAVRQFHDEAAKEQEARRLQHIRKTREEEINSETFAKATGGAHVRKAGKLEGRMSDKKHKRKTKARNLYNHLDPKRHGHV